MFFHRILRSFESLFQSLQVDDLSSLPDPQMAVPRSRRPPDLLDAAIPGNRAVS